MDTNTIEAPPNLPEGGGEKKSNQYKIVENRSEIQGGFLFFSSNTC
jgi:hypothetical protein